MLAWEYMANQKVPLITCTSTFCNSIKLPCRLGIGRNIRFGFTELTDTGV